METEIHYANKTGGVTFSIKIHNLCMRLAFPRKTAVYNVHLPQRTIKFASNYIFQTGTSIFASSKFRRNSDL